MKKINLLFIWGIIVFAFLYAFTNLKLGSITGRVSPVESIGSIMLINGVDTLKTPSNKGAFKFVDIKQGVYTLYIKSISPYKDLSIPNVAVKDSSTTNIGEIILQQY